MGDRHWYYDLVSMGSAGEVRRSRYKVLATPVPLLAVAVGLSALAGYGFIGSVGNSVSPPDVAALSGLYFMVNIVALGAFSGLEQETTRAMSRAATEGRRLRSVLRRQVAHGAVMTAAGLLLVAAFSDLLVHHELHGQWSLVWALGVAVVGACCGALVRGCLAGTQRFRLYALELSTEGLARLVPSVLLWLIGVHAAWAFGLVFSGALLFAALVGMVALRASGGLEAGVSAGAAARDTAAQPEPASGNRAAASLGILVAGNLVGQFVTNGTPLVIAPRLATVAGAALGASINAAIVLARTPLFALFPIQSLVLPKLTAAVTRGDLTAVRNRMALLVGYCAAVGVVGSLGFAVLGGWVLRTFMGIPDPLGGGTLALLGLGTTCLMAALVLQDALVALDLHRVVLLAWSAGSAVMIAEFALPLAPVTAATAACLTGPVAVAAVMAFVVRRGTRARRDPSFAPDVTLDSPSAASL